MHRAGPTPSPLVSPLCSRELWRMRWMEAAITELRRYLGLTASTDHEQRASALQYISKCELALERPHEARAAALQALAEYSLPRDGSQAASGDSEAAAGTGEYLQPWEPWLALARASRRVEDWPAVYWAATRVLAAASHPAALQAGAAGLGAEPHDLAALAAFYMGLHREAVERGEAALALSPHDERLQSNLRFYRQAAPGIVTGSTTPPGTAPSPRP